MSGATPGSDATGAGSPSQRRKVTDAGNLQSSPPTDHVAALGTQHSMLDERLLSELKVVADSLGGSKLKESWGSTSGELWHAPSRDSTMLNMAFVSATGHTPPPQDTLEEEEAKPKLSFSRVVHQAGLTAEGQATVASGGVPAEMGASPSKGSTPVDAGGAAKARSPIGLRVTKRSGWAGVRKQIAAGNLKGYSPWNEIRKTVSSSTPNLGSPGGGKAGASGGESAPSHGVVLTSATENDSWKQLAGHAENFAVPDDTRFILKLRSDIECNALTAGMECDVAKRYIVPYFGTVHTGEDAEGKGGNDWMKMSNLLNTFVNPSLMDVKMGQRTYLHQTTNQKRLDLLKKMVAVDPNAPSAEEKKNGVTKPRYMRFREEQSSSVELGFRIEAMHVAEKDEISNSTFSKYFVPKDEAGVTGEIKRFIHGKPRVRQQFLDRLKEMRTNLPSSEFFKHHEIVGSSLLFVYDDEDNATVTMLDFGKTMPSKEPLRHDVPYVYPTLSHEEGYLVGVENLIKIITATGAGPEYAEYA